MTGRRWLRWRRARRSRLVICALDSSGSGIVASGLIRRDSGVRVALVERTAEWFA